MTSLDSLAVVADEAGKLILLHPSTNAPIRDKNDVEAHILLLGIDSAEGQKQRREATTRALQRRNKALTADELEAQAVDQLVALTKGWHLVSPDGEVIDFPFTPANARQLYGNRKFAWIREQADQFVVDRAGFFGKPSTN